MAFVPPPLNPLPDPIDYEAVEVGSAAGSSPLAAPAANQPPGQDTSGRLPQTWGGGGPRRSLEAPKSSVLASMGSLRYQTPQLESPGSGAVDEELAAAMQLAEQRREEARARWRRAYKVCESNKGMESNKRGPSPSPPSC